MVTGTLMRITYLFFVLLVFILTSGIVRADEWGNEREIVEEFFPQKIILTSATIDSLLKQPLTLNDCVAIALKNNIQLQIDRMEYNRVYYARRATYQNFLPDVSVDLHHQKTVPLDSNYFEANRIYKEGVALSVTEKMPLGGYIQFSKSLSTQTDGLNRRSDRPTDVWTISFTQPLLKGFGYSIAFSEVELANLDFQIEQMRLKDIILNTIFQVKEAYFNVIRKKKVVAATEAAIERDKTLKEVSKAKVEAKLATRRDVLSAEIILQKDYGELVNAQTEYESALDALKDVMGIEISRKISLATETLDFNPIPVQEETWVEYALEHNLGIKLQELNLKKAEFQTRLAANDLLPDMSLQAGYTRVDDRDISQDSREYDVYGRLSISYPILNMNASANRQRAILAQRQLEKSLEDARRKVILAVRNSARNLVNSTQRIKILLKNIDAAKEKVIFATTMFNMGRASNLDITDAQEDLLKAEVNYVEELADYYVELARLEQLLGGYPFINNK